MRNWDYKQNESNSRETAPLSPKSDLHKMFSLQYSYISQRKCQEKLIKIMITKGKLLWSLNKFSQPIPYGKVQMYVQSSSVSRGEFVCGYWG